MNHFVILVLAVISVIALSIFYRLATLFFAGIIGIGTQFVCLLMWKEVYQNFELRNYLT
jgi:hypothetical protein